MAQQFNREVVFALSVPELLLLVVMLVLLVFLAAWCLAFSVRRRADEHYQQCLQRQTRDYQEHIRALERELRLARHSAVMNSAGLLKKRSEAINRVYEDLVRCTTALQGLVSTVRFHGDPGTVNEALANSVPLVQAYAGAYEDRRLYFSETTGGWISELNSGCVRMLENMRELLADQEVLSRDLVDKLGELMNHATSLLEEARNEIEKQFRDVLKPGVDSSPAVPQRYIAQ